MGAAINYKNEFSRFGQNLSKALKKRAKTQVWLAEQLDIDKTHVNKWVKNRVLPSSEYMDRIAKALDYEIEELITGIFKDEAIYRTTSEGRNPQTDGGVSISEMAMVEKYIDSIIDEEDYEKQQALKRKVLFFISGLLRAGR